MPDVSSEASRTTQAPLPIPARSVLKDLPELHGQIHGLGGAWILLGLISLGATAFLLKLAAAGDVVSPVSWPILLLGSFGVCWITVGIGALLKMLWSIRGGLAAGYLSIAIGVVSFVASAANPRSGPGASLLPVLIQIVLVRQARRVLRGVKDADEQPTLA